MIDIVGLELVDDFTFISALNKGRINGDINSLTIDLMDK